MAKETNVTINGKNFSIKRFTFTEGNKVRLKLAKIILPVLASFLGEGFKQVSDPTKNVKEMSMNELLGEIDSNTIERSVKSLVMSISDDQEIYNLVHQRILPIVWYENKTPLTEQNLDALSIADKIDYSDTDKLVLEVVKAQGFLGKLGNLLGKSEITV